MSTVQNKTVKDIVARLLNLPVGQIVLYEVGGWLEPKRTRAALQGIANVLNPEDDDLDLPTASGSIYAMVAIKANGTVGREFRVDIDAKEIEQL